jgi:ketosteroid isomerase-like protein
MTSDEQLIRRLYEWFNRRDKEGVLAALADDVACFDIVGPSWLKNVSQ